MSDDSPDWTQRVDVPLKFTVMSDTPGGYGNAGQGLVVNDTETGLGYSEGKVDNHSARHENGGADPISNLGGNVAFPDRSYFLINLGSDFTTIAGETHKLPFNTNIFDNNNDFDTTNYYFIVPKDGFYWFSLSVRVSDYSDNERVFISIKSEAESILFYQIQPLTGSWVHDLKISAGYKLTAGDKVWATGKSYNNSILISNNSFSTFFCGCLIA